MFDEKGGRMAIYAKVEGVKGDVTTKGFEGFIELLGVESPVVSRSVRMDVGKNMDRGLGMPQFGRIKLLKAADSSSHKFFEAVHDGSVFPTVEIHHVMVSNTPLTYAKLILKNVAVDFYGDRATQNHHLIESIRLAYSGIQRSFVPRDANNKPKTPIITGYDITKASKA
jgi:type VI protein secretion system component Hcp